MADLYSDRRLDVLEDVYRKSSQKDTLVGEVRKKDRRLKRIREINEGWQQTKKRAKYWGIGIAACAFAVAASPIIEKYDIMSKADNMIDSIRDEFRPAPRDFTKR